MKTIIVIGKKWRDTVNGNTYFNTCVIDGEKKFFNGFEYGYGNYWEYAGRRIIDREKLVKRCKDFEIIYIFAGYDTKSNLKNNNFECWRQSTK